MHPLYVPPAEANPGSRSCGRRILLHEIRTSITVALRLLLVSFCVMISSSRAGLIYWGSEGFVENADSRDYVWTEDFTMSLGVFRKGFVPLRSNRGEWLENWNPLGTATFDREESRFAGVVDVSEPLPAGADQQVYFWAKNGEDLTKGPEWLLITRADWKWPASSAPDMPALIWTTSAPALLVMGGIATSGRHLTSDRVVPVPVSREAWLAKFFPNSPGSLGPDEDPDGDGLSNRLEYFLGSDPSDGASKNCPEICASADGTSLKLQRNPYASSGFDVEISPDMKSWSSADPETVQDRPDLIEVRFPHDPTVKSAFFRFHMKEETP